MGAPVRLQLSRSAGFSLGRLSLDTNGLHVVKVTRPGPFGNPFSRENAIESGYATDATWQAFVVECFRDWLGSSQSGRDWWQGPQSDKRRMAILDGLPSLRGRNLACWCKPGQPCHADVLLELANRPVCEEVP